MNPTDYPHTLTPEIAFELGSLKYGRFYDMAVWQPNLEDFPLYKFFFWHHPYLRSATGNDNDWQFAFYGDLDFDLFNTTELKHAYIKGRLSAYSVTIKDTEIHVCYANSFKSRDKFAEFINDILKEKFGGAKVWDIKKSEVMACSVPRTPDVTISADKEVIDFICK